jgi:hypothetical protein
VTLSLMTRSDRAIQQVRRPGSAEKGSAGEAAFLVEVIGDGGVEEGELLQSSHAPEHCPLPSSIR